MSSLDHAQTIVDKLTAAGINATCDPRSATPPCVLLTPPTANYDHYCGATGEWNAYALASTTANLDAWAQLDELEAAVAGVLPLERRSFVAYSLSPDNPSLPAYQLSFVEGFDL